MTPSSVPHAESLLDADRPLDAVDVLLGALPPTAESLRGLARAVGRLDRYRLAADLLGVLRWVTIGWAVVYLLIAIDPALKDKIETARATAGLLSPPPDRKEPPPVRSEA